MANQFLKNDLDGLLTGFAENRHLTDCQKENYSPRKEGTSRRRGQLRICPNNKVKASEIEVLKRFIDRLNQNSEILIISENAGRNKKTGEPVAGAGSTAAGITDPMVNRRCGHRGADDHSGAEGEAQRYGQKIGSPVLRRS